ncbi:UDP-N-acetylmuramoyl-L-alanine--D-glutamate ligase [Neolewinella agarilytica]|uniref:UDP-N-acetylmuramoylalanine--D-glutamate ligase n=1 Tax=Neolewinella agarilytica TaxID=478744 RepID=A0A1H9EL59_9BACT|nr:UDP-N-acetylmuramoyl-L-alanine--D-glutamate ligase [Neolewinella agarilytica]SEQ26375.1 UDP-N-acetylmuramoylalanine--D-glutamate ligase [Neolewinella agarilytica]
MSTKKTIAILGAGESGVSAARLAQREGYAVFVSDAGPGNEKYLQELREAGIEFETNQHTGERIFAADEVVKSPGIPDSVPMIVELRNAGKPVISEIEFAYRFAPRGAEIIGITGSNGKTTTTMLTHHLLDFAGVNALAGGNLGDSFARLLLDEEPADVYVLELSSFQLDGMVDFRPSIATVLNITPDHLDRYNYELEKYADSKVSIAKNQKLSDRLLVLADQQTIAPALRRQSLDTNITTISPEDVRGTSVFIDGYEFNMGTGSLRGRHNGLNALFAIRIAMILGVTEKEIQLALDSFRPAAHRMEVIPTSDGRTWINDSKATNVDASYFALEAMTGPTVWVAGGTDKGNDYDVLREIVQDKVHTLICMGIDNSKLVEAFKNDVPTLLECSSAAAAVTFANQRAKTGDTILLSPCCASFDLFKNYIDRGDQFRTAVKNLNA